MTKAVFFDAVGTLFDLTKTVGDHYALVGQEVGLKLNAEKLDAAFYSAWARMPTRQASDRQRENDGDEQVQCVFGTICHVHRFSAVSE